MRVLLLVTLVAVPALAQPLTPPPAPPADEPPASESPRAAPPEAVQPSPPTATAQVNRAGWARPGGAMGFGLAAVPVGLAIASSVTAWTEKNAIGKADLTLSHMLVVSAGLSAPLMALVPTFAGRSATVADDLAHAPRALRILGWILTGIATVDLVTTPLYDKAFGLVFHSDGPSVITSFTTVLAGLMASGGVVLLSFAALKSAERSEMQSEEVAPPATVFAPSVAPVLTWVPGPGGGAALAGLSGSW